MTYIDKLKLNGINYDIAFYNEEGNTKLSSLTNIPTDKRMISVSLTSDPLSISIDDSNDNMEIGDELIIICINNTANTITINKSLFINTSNLTFNGYIDTMILNQNDGFCMRVFKTSSTSYHINVSEMYDNNYLVNITNNTLFYNNVMIKNE